MALIKTHIELDLGWLTTNPQIPYDEGELLANALLSLNDTLENPIAKIEFRDALLDWTHDHVFDTYNDDLIISGDTDFHIYGDVELDSSESTVWYYNISIKNPLNLMYVNSGWYPNNKIDFNNQNHILANNSYFITEVKDNDSGNPINDVNVTISKGDFIKSTNTRSDGVGIISNIPVEDGYSILYQKIGYVSKTVNNYDVEAKGDVELLENNLTPVTVGT